MKKKVDIFTLSIYGFVIFPKALRHIDEAITNLFDRLDKHVTPVPAILAETFRSLSMCRRAGEGKFIGCAQLLLVWFHSHFWKVDKFSYRVFSENCSTLKEEAAMPRRDDVSEESWMAILLNLQEEDVEWKAPWMVSDKILYQCGSFDLGAIGYAPLLVLRQYKSRKFISVTYGLSQYEFSYKGDNYKKKQTRRMKRLAVGSVTTHEYNGWFSKRINDNIPGPSLEGARSIEECMRVVLSELDIIRRYFEKKNSVLRKKIKQLDRYRLMY
ncbi:hypothetical protein J1N35_028956 [Gossypium stocksii]|uniref:DUF7745 domain-containing protein n=1 Tax=Gossypium stocksii TaxID=47602 RepID=A0A9D3ZSL9_9ROSI|nr:hypothetical protein J1N35_028956 [Gossypium stocksii]